MKKEEVVIGESINHAVWKKGIQKPPRRIRIHATIFENRVYAELLGVDFKFPEKKEEVKQEEKAKEKSEEKPEKEEKKESSVETDRPEKEAKVEKESSEETKGEK